MHFQKYVCKYKFLDVHVLLDLFVLFNQSCGRCEAEYCLFYRALLQKRPVI